MLDPGPEGPDPHHGAPPQKKEMPARGRHFGSELGVYRSAVENTVGALAKPCAVAVPGTWRVSVTAAAATIVARSTLRLHMETSTPGFLDSKLPGRRFAHCQPIPTSRVGACLRRASESTRGSCLLRRAGRGAARRTGRATRRAARRAGRA